MADNPYQQPRQSVGIELERTPRSVPLAVRIRLLLGGFLNQIGWVLLGFGMVFVWVFQGDRFLVQCWQFRGTLTEAPGRVVGIDDARMSVNKRKMFAYRFEYKTPDGAVHDGVSYDYADAADTVKPVTVEYAPDRPYACRIRGMDSSKLGAVGLLPAAFPLIGVAFIIAALRKARRGLRLLREGHRAIGRLVSCTPTNTSVNDRTVYKFVFEFPDADGQTRHAVARTHEPERFSGEGEADPTAEDPGEDQEPAVPEVFEPLLYDPHDPDRAILLDDLPGGPRIDEFGRIRVDSPWAVLRCLPIPLIVIAGHAAYLYLR